MAEPGHLLVIEGSIPGNAGACTIGAGLPPKYWAAEGALTAP